MPLRWPDLVLILLVVVAIFTAGKIPEISRGVRSTYDNLRGSGPEHESVPEPTDDDAVEPSETS